MKVKWFHSLSMKLFALMSVCLVLTVAAVTWQQTSVLQDYLHRELEDSTVMQSKEVARNLTTFLQHWTGLGTIAVTRMSGTSAETYGEFIASFVNSNPDLEALQLFYGSDGKKGVFRSRINGPFDAAVNGDSKVKALMNFSSGWIQNLDRKPQQRRLEFADLRSVTGLPLLALAMRFKVAGEAHDLWAIFAVRTESMLSAIPADSTMRGWVLDTKFNILVSKIEASGEELVSSDLLDVIRAARSEYGFRAFTNERGEDTLGAYTQLPDYGLIIIVTQDARGARIAILKTILHTLMWAWLLMLVAVMVSYILSNRVTSNLKAVTEAIQRIAAGDFASNLKVTSRDEVAIVSHSVNSMAAQIRDLLESKVAAARQEKELETAKLVQETLFPRGEIKAEFLSITARSVPASECGGDWWGHFKISEKCHYLFIADATGHGVAAALVTAIVYSICHSLSHQLRDASDGTKLPSEILQALNRTLYETGLGETTMTFFAARFDLEKGVISFANAGHNQPFILPKSPDDDRLGSSAGGAYKSEYINRFNNFRLKARGNPLGTEENSSYRDEEITFEAGDRVVLFTDGLFECTDMKQQPWGERQLRRSLDKHSQLSGVDFREAVLKDAFEHFNSQPTDDDITLVVLDIAAEWKRITLSQAS